MKQRNHELPLISLAWPSWLLCIAVMPFTLSSVGCASSGVQGDAVTHVVSASRNAESAPDAKVTGMRGGSCDQYLSIVSDAALRKDIVALRATNAAFMRDCPHDPGGYYSEGVLLLDEALRNLAETGAANESVRSPGDPRFSTPMRLCAEAIQLFNRVEELKPDYRFVHYNRGQCFMMRGETEQALSAANKAQALNPNMPDVYALRVRVRWFSGKPARDALCQDVQTLERMNALEAAQLTKMAERHCGRDGVASRMRRDFGSKMCARVDPNGCLTSARETCEQRATAGLETCLTESDWPKYFGAKDVARLSKCAGERAEEVARAAQDFDPACEQKDDRKRPAHDASP